MKRMQWLPYDDLVLSMRTEGDISHILLSVFGISEEVSNVKQALSVSSCVCTWRGEFPVTTVIKLPLTIV